MSWLINKKDIEWFKGLFGIKPKPKPEPIPEPVKEIVYTPFETIVLRARISEPELQRYAIIDPNYTMTQVKNQLAIELMEQIMNQNLIEYKSIQDFGQNIVEAQILVSVKK
jgi:hypothetical protein